jgi:hypothetical protein
MKKKFIEDLARETANTGNGQTKKFAKRAGGFICTEV